MFKLIKFTFFLLLVLVGLYFFGDFKINDTHVKTWLHEKVTIQRLVLLKEQIVSAYTKMRYIFSDQVEKPSAQSAVQNQTTEAGKLLEQISSQDQQKLLKLLEKNMEATPQN